MSATDDRAAIAAIHRDWWDANEGLDVRGMTADLAADYLMWNLNGHPYFSRAEAEHLFGYYREHLVPDDPAELWNVDVTVSGDLAYVTSFGMLPFLVATDEGGGASVVGSMGPHYERSGELIRFLFRETMVLRRNADAPRGWEICHFHASPLAPREESRPGFGDTSVSRQDGEPER